VLDHVDVNAIIERVDVNQLLDRIDVERLIGRIDIDELLKRADIDALMERVDVKALVDRAGIPEIVAESTSHLTGSALDLFRRPIVGIDEITFRGLNRLIRRDPREFPTGPGALVNWVDEHTRDTGVRTGRYAGPVTRLIAFVLDGLIVTTSFTLIVAGISYLVELVSSLEVAAEGWGIWYIVGFTIWAFLYLWLSIAIFGKTLGKTVMGWSRRIGGPSWASGLRASPHVPVELRRRRHRLARHRVREGAEGVARPFRQDCSGLRLGEQRRQAVHPPGRLAGAEGSRGLI
jgi:hypothetical protein